MAEKPTTPETKKPKFAIGQTVTVLRDKGIFESDWRVAQYALNGTSVVVVKRNERGKQLSKTITEKELLGWQLPTPKIEPRTIPPTPENKAKFIPDQIVKVKRSGGEIEDGWRVSHYAKNGRSIVLLKGNLEKTILEKDLLSWQNPPLDYKKESQVENPKIKNELMLARKEERINEVKENKKRRFVVDSSGEATVEELSEEGKWTEKETTPEISPEMEDFRKLKEKMESAQNTLEENKKMREAYFESFKKPKKGELKFLADREEKEKAYRAAKNKIVKEFLDKGDEEGAQNFILGEVELKRKFALENGLVSKKERIIAGVSRGIEKWDSWGKDEGMKGYLQRLAKTGVSLAMIGAISGLSVEGLAKIGIGSASAVGGGITSYLGRRVAFGTAISAMMAKIPDSKKKWVSRTLLAGSAGIALATGGLFAGGALVASSALGLALSRIIKRYDKKIQENIKKSKEGKIDLNTLEEDAQKMEVEMEKVLKDAEKARVWGKAIQAMVAIGGSAATLELMGAVHHDTATKSDTGEFRHGPPLAHGKNIMPPTATSSIENNFHAESITFEHGHGAIQTILDLKTQMREHYHNDFSHAPKSVQDFMAETNVTKQATQLGFYDPEHTAESAMVLKGSTLGFDQHGNLTFHDAGGANTILIHGDNPTIEKYHGKMFDSDHRTTHPAVNISREPQAPVEHTETPHLQTPESVLSNNHASPTSFLESQANIPPAETIIPSTIGGNFTYGTTNEYGAGGNHPYGIGPEHVNRGFYGPGGERIEHYFPDLSPDGNDFLNHHLDFVGNNPYHLTGAQLIEAYNASEQNINHFWGHDLWDSFKDHKAGAAIKHTSLTDGNTEDGKLGDYLTILKNFSGLKPKSAGIFHWKSETVAEFSARALQKIEAKGQLETFEDNLGR